MKNNTYIDGLRLNDYKIIREIYSNYLSRIEKHIISRNGTAADAKDIFQDALMIIYKKIQSPDFELTSSFYTYLFGICYYTWERRRRNKSKIEAMPESYEEMKAFKYEPAIESDILNREKHKVFKDNFAKLGDFCRRILKLYFSEDSMNAIAEKLGLKNAHTARNRKYRCQKKLEEFIHNDERYEEFVSNNV